MTTDAGTEPSFEATVKNGRTIVTITGDRNVAVVIRSRRGERIYLPPEDVVGDTGEVVVSPYQASAPPDEDDEQDEETFETPYDHSGERATGRRRRPEGSRIVHPEPATDVRLLR